jgi:hypothetical protein
MDLALRLLQAKTQEIAALRGQVAALTDRMMDVSQTLTR